MAANIVGDRAIARSEAEKLITYIGPDKRFVSLEDVAACIGNSAALSLDDLTNHVASGNFPSAERALTHILSEGIPAVTVLRHLQTHFTRLHAVKSRLQAGEDLEQALKKLRPPLFWKAKPAFQAQLAAWRPAQIEQALLLLMAAEARCKQTAFNPGILCSRAVLSLSQTAARAAGARQHGSRA